MWELEIIPMTKLKRLKCCWGLADKRVAMRSAYERVQQHNWLNKRHAMWSLARNGTPEYRPIILTVGNTVWDGNHTSLALIHLGYKGRILRVWRR